MFYNIGFRVLDLGFRIQGSGLKNWVLGVWAYGSRFRV
jgi:hypothetical protein